MQTDHEDEAVGLGADPARDSAVQTAAQAAEDEAVQLAAESVKAKRCILFLGAGVHAPPPEGSPFAYPPDQRPPIGKALSRLLAERCDLKSRFPNEDPDNLQRVALFYEVLREREQHVQTIIDAVQAGKRPSPMLRALAKLDFPIVITTNYDQLFETALIKEDKQPRATVYTPNLEQTRDPGEGTVVSPVLFKLHGDIGRPETIVVTDEDYIQFVLRMSNKEPFDPIPLSLKYHFTSWTTLFVGYSLLDYNLRLLFKTLRWKLDDASIPPTYSVDLNPDPLILDVWHNRRRYVRFIAQDVWKFVPQLYQYVVGEELTPG
jgi:hypothetical protein